MHSSNEELYLWTFSFDLSQESLKKYYKGSPTHSYDEIKKYLFANGFDNKDLKEGSVYVTSSPMTNRSVTYIVDKMFSDLPWLSECVSRAVIATLPEIRYDYGVYAQIYKESPEHIKEYLDYSSSNKKVEPNAQDFSQNNEIMPVRINSRRKL